MSVLKPLNLNNDTFVVAPQYSNSTKTLEMLKKTYIHSIHSLNFEGSAKKHLENHMRFLFSLAF